MITQYSRVVSIPENVLVEKRKNSLLFIGPLGRTTLNLQSIDPKGLAAISINQKEQIIHILTSSKSLHGLYKTQLSNRLYGVLRGYLMYLKIIGVGYRAHLDKNILFLKLGYSHDLVFQVPSSIRVFLIDPTLVCLFGLDKNQITHIASKICYLRRPSVYKGKGIRLLDENIFIKTGKKK